MATDEHATRADVDRLYRTVAVLRSELDTLRATVKINDEKATERTKRLTERVDKMGTRIQDAITAGQKLAKRVNLMTPKNIEGAMRTLEHMVGYILPTQMRHLVATEVYTQLKARKATPDQRDEFMAAWFWAMDNKNDEWWSRLKDYSVDSLLGIVTAEHEEYLKARRRKQ